MLNEIRGQLSKLDLESASGYGVRAGNSTMVSWRDGSDPTEQGWGRTVRH